MLKMLNLRSFFSNRITILSASKCKYSSKNNQSSSDSNLDPPLNPLSLSYNSYENLSCDANIPPVIIMHGNE